jgi:hypothetical protein
MMSELKAADEFGAGALGCGAAACCEAGACAGDGCWAAGGFWLQPQDTAATNARAAIKRVRFFSDMASSHWPTFLAYFQNAHSRIKRAALPYLRLIVNGICFASLSPM